MSAGNVAELQALAEKTAATVQAAVRHWWLDPENPLLLHIAAERTFVGARPIAVHFTVRLKPTQPSAAVGSPRMRVGVVLSPPSLTDQRRPKKSLAQPAARKTKSQIHTKGVTKRTNRQDARAQVRETMRTGQVKEQSKSSTQREKRETAQPRASRQKSRDVS